MAEDIEALRSLFRPHVKDPRTLSQLTAQLHEVLEGAEKYIVKFRSLFSLPSDAYARREALAELLTEISVLVEHTGWHEVELRKEIESALREIDTNYDNDAQPSG
jgi:hypothetical protein